MEILADIVKTNFNKLGTDYKAEVVAAGLLKNNVSLNQVFVKRLGSNDRSFNKDVKAIVNKFYGLEEDAVVIETYKEGIYDYLPEGFFHPPNLGDMKNGVESVIQGIRRQKEVEESARVFFQPFELESYYTQLNALIHENNLDLINDSNAFLKIIDELWPLLKELDTDTAKIFFNLMPMLHSVRGNKIWFERCLSAFLKIPVEVTYERNMLDMENIDKSLLISNALLGITSILCGTHADGERNWVINIGPIPPHLLDNFIPGHPFRQLLQSFYEYCLPANVSVRQNFITAQDEYGFYIKEAATHENYLGYSTFL